MLPMLEADDPDMVTTLTWQLLLPMLEADDLDGLRAVYSLLAVSLNHQLIYFISLGRGSPGSRRAPPLRSPDAVPS